jgi:hypothetical protein
MIATHLFCIFTAEGVDADGPFGECHDMGEVAAGDALTMIARAEHIRRREGWPGRVYVTDMLGNLVDWPQLVTLN